MNPVDSRQHSDLKARMRRVAVRFRASQRLSEAIWDAGSYPIATHIDGEPEVKVLVWFPAMGCYWSARGGGCTMCDFGAGTSRRSIGEALTAFKEMLGHLDPGLRRVHIGPGGSFLSDAEVPPDLRRGVLHSLDRFRFLRSVSIETRPGLVTEPGLMDVIDHLPDPVEGLTVGFGLECLDDLVREAAINKGFGTRSIRKAVRAIDRVNSAQQEVRVAFEIYVLLKPLFLSEQEGIDEALRTIQWAYAQGAESVSLFMNTVKPRTVQGYLASRRDLPPPVRYEPPFYRSAIQVLRQLPPEQRRLTKVLGMQSGIVATELPRGCALCTPFLSGSLSAHNFIGDPTILDLAAGSWCPCKRQWLDSLAIPVESVPSRISAGLNVLESFLK